MSENVRELEGKVAIVTGAAGAGIGAVTAMELAKQGAKVIAAGLAGTGVEACAESIVNAGFEAVSCLVDIADEKSVEALIAFTRETYGRLDVLDNNAARQGIMADQDIMTMPVEVWDSVFAVNVRGTMLMCKHALPLMIESGGGSIINISSGTSTAGDMVTSAYGTSKGAVNTLTRYVATQYGAQGIRCNALALGLVNTPALEAGMPEVLRDVFQSHKLAGRIGKPEDVAAMVCFMASDKSSWITGQVYPVDGGFYAHVPTTPEVGRIVAQMMAQAENN